MNNKYLLLLIGLALSSNSSNSRASEGGLLAIGGGAGNSLGVTSAGTVYAAGYNNVGQLGNGTTTSSSTPVAVSGLTDCIKVAVSPVGLSLALKADGTVWAWGNNASGQIGDGSLTNRSTPVQVSGLAGAVNIAAGVQSSYALKSDGTVWGWGSNSIGQLGDGTTTDRTTPVQVVGLTRVTGLACGTSHVVTLRDDGTVWAWGSNSFGSVGDGTTTNRTAPVQITGLTGIAKVSAGYYHTFALKADGSLRAWGQNSSGQLGLGYLGGIQSSPLTVTGLSQVTTVAAGGAHSIAIKSDGSLWAWGSDASGALGDSAAVSSSNSPIYVAGFPSDAVAVAAGGSNTLALESNGLIWAWGANANGVLGDGTVTNQFLPSFVIAR